MSNSAFNNTIPTFIKAKTAEELRDLMLKMNTSNATNYSFYSIYSKGQYHYAWYYVRQSDLIAALSSKLEEEKSTAKKVNIGE